MYLNRKIFCEVKLNERWLVAMLTSFLFFWFILVIWAVKLNPEELLNCRTEETVNGNSNFQFLYHTICMLITVMILD